MSSDNGIEPGLLDELLGLPARAQQARLLRERQLLDAGGLDLLLDAAETLLDADPGQARRLAELCAGVGARAGGAASCSSRRGRGSAPTPGGRAGWPSCARGWRTVRGRPLLSRGPTTY